jgi:two-component system CheB/CheR fusion protein
LETLNEELQATVEELNTTNDDLHARSVELQEVAHVSEEARAWLEAILANMSDAVLVVDGAGTPVLTNAAYQRTFGVPGVTLLDEHGQPLPLEAAPRQRAARGESFGMELTLAAEDGARRWFEASGQPFRGADDRRRGGVVVVRDITERSLQRMQEEFVATISHDLRTPLTAARAGLGLVEASVADRLRPDEGQLVSNARRNVERLGLLIDDLVTFNQLQSGTLEAERAPLDLRAVVTGAVAAVESLIREKGQTLEVTLRRALPTVGDARRLEQVLVNLLGNAYEHTPPGTRIAVSGRVADGEVVVTVADNGPGIPTERLEEIFGRTRARNGASGLGLLISRRLTELNGGRLWVESPPEGGIAFHVALPRRRRARGVERESVRA